MKIKTDLRKIDKIEVIEDLEEGGYVAFYPKLLGCITVGETVEEAIMNAKEAKKVWIEAINEENGTFHN